MKLVIASPSYGPIAPEAVKGLRVAIMRAAKDHQWIGDVSADRMAWAATRNASLVGAVKSGADGVVWVDSDIIPPTDGIARLLEHNLDFVTGIYFQRIAPHFPLFGNLIGEDKFAWAAEFPQQALAPVDGCGFGFVFTSMKLIKAVAAKYAEPFQFGVNSEDLTFCRRAKEVGFQLYVDTGILCEHLGDAVRVGFDQFSQVRAVHVRP